MARKMKDSGIEWIGEIPEGWEVATIGHLFSVTAGGDAKPHLYSYVQDAKHPYPVYTNSSNPNQIYAYTSAPKFSENTITVTGRGDIGHAFYRNTKFDAIIRLLVLAPKSALDCRYYAYWIDNVSIFFTNSAAVGQLSAQQIFPYKTCYLPLCEQQSIANHLDFYCSKIEHILADIQNSIQEYKKLKQAVITQAVTKGVRGKREMKDSGVEWIGEIPEEWNKCKLKNISIDIGDGLHGTPKFGDSGEVYFINGNNFSSEYVEPKFDTKKLCLEESLNYPKPELTEQTIMISLNGSYGKVCLYRYFPMLLGKSAGYITLLPSINRRYVRYYLSSTPAQIMMTLSLNGTTIPNLSLNTLYNFPTILPSASEQAEIADCLDAKCAEIDGLIAKKEQLVKELESYKKSLIYEVVTGKREV